MPRSIRDGNECRFPVKNVFFVPFGQDDPIEKPNSLVAKFELIPEAAVQALNGRQIQPVLR